MTPTEIHNLVTAIGDLVGVLRTADPADKAAVYRHLGLKLTYMEEAHTLQVRSQPNLSGMGFSSCPRSDTNRNPTASITGRRHHVAVRIDGVTRGRWALSSPAHAHAAIMRPSDTERTERPASLDGTVMLRSA